MARSDGSLVFDTKIDTKSFETGVSKLKSTAKAGFAAVGAAAAAGLGAAIKMGSDFEEAMSSVSAISMATKEEYEMLSKAAKEMGETTQFSATQAANALEYLSLAGYSAEDSVKALPKVLDLAAAGGMDLAYASDLLTDSMAVMGLGIEDMDNFSDQLAMAASKSNTSVQQLGEAVLVAGGQAKLAGMDVDDMNTALGILADNGIKGSEGGTALRNTLKNLYTPTSAAAGEMESLGVKTADAKGELRPMQDVLKDLDKALSKLTEADKIEAMGNIFDTRTIAPATALLKNSNERWDELNGYLNDCDGLAKQMAKTMNDNLKGKMKLVASAAEGLAISVYEGIEEPLKDAADTGASEISKLTRAFSAGELKSALENTGRLLGGLVSTGAKLAAAVIPPLVNVLGFLGDNLDITAVAITGCVVAFQAMNNCGITGSLLKIVASFQQASLNVSLFAAANTACALTSDAVALSLTAQEIVVAGLTGQISIHTAVTALATKAQIAFKAAWANNPVGMAIAVVAGLTAVLYGLYKSQNKVKSNTQILIEQSQERVKALEEEKKEYEELKQTQIDQATADLAQVAQTQVLYNELKTLVGVNGEVNESNQNRVNFILGELNKAYGTEYKLIDGVISGYKDMQTEIDNLIEKKKWEIVQKAALPLYEEALSTVLKKRIDREKEAQKVEEQRKKVEEAQIEVANRKAKANEKQSKKQQEISDAQLKTAQRNLDKEKKVLEEQEKAYDACNESLKISMADKDKYERASVEATAGNYDAAIGILSEYTSDFHTKMSEASGDIEQQRQIAEEEYKLAAGAVETYLDDVSNGAEEFDEGTLRQLTTYASEVAKTAQSVGANIGDGMITGLNGKKETLLGDAIALADRLVSSIKNRLGIHSPSTVARDDIGRMISEGIAIGIDDGKSEVQKAMEEINKTIAQSNFEQSLEFATTKDEIWRIKQNEVDGLLDSEKEYLAEKARIEKERSDAELQDRLNNAKDAKEKEKIKQERIEEEAKKGQDAYLENLRIAAEKERKINEALQKDIEKLKQKAVDNFTAMAEAAMDSIEELESAKNDFKGKLDDYTSLYYTYELPAITINGESVAPKFAGLADISKQNEKVKQYVDNLKALRERGDVPKEMIDKIRSLSVDEGLLYTDALLKADDEAFNKHIEDYKEGVALHEEWATLVYSEDTAELGKKIAEDFKEIPEDLWGIGKESAEQFGDGFIEQLEGTLEDVNRVISDSLSELSPEAGNAYLYVVGQLEEAGYTISEDFTDIGDSSGENFWGEFFEKFNGKIKTIPGKLSEAFDGMAEILASKIEDFQFKIELKAAESGTSTVNNVYNSQYNFSGGGQGVNSDIAQLRAYEIVERQRNG